MKMLQRCLFAATLVISFVVQAATPEQNAADLFSRYQTLGRAFDPAAADLYAGNAKITNKRTYPTGEVKEMSLPAKQYKALVRAAMPAAKARGDTSTYSDIVYTVEGNTVRIAATRFSELKKYSSRFILVVGPSADGSWQIFEEHSESRP